MNWLTKKEAAAQIGVSVDTIERRAIPWQDEPKPHKIRFKYLQLDDNAPLLPRFYPPDVEALLTAPKKPAAAHRKLYAASRVLTHA